MQHTVANFLRAALVPELGADIAAGAAGHIQLALVTVAALGAFPHQLAALFYDLDLTIIAAHLAIVALGVQLSIHDVFIDELDHIHGGIQIVLHIGHFHIADGAAGAQLLELALKSQLGKGINMLAHMHMVAVGDIVFIGDAGDDPVTAL